MGINDSEQWIADIDEVLNTLPELGELEGRRIMITGCAGLICSGLIDVLIRRNETHENKILIVAAGRDEERIRERFAPYDKRDWFEFSYFDAVTSNIQFCCDCDYIVHGAGNASPYKITKEPVETMMGNIIGLKNLLDYAKKCSSRRVLYISSSEVYGIVENKGLLQPNDYGYVDLLKSRNSYSMGKRAAETLCVSYADEYDVDIVIVRPGHIYGPTALKTDNRVSSLWAHSAARGKDIVMKSDGLQIRSYCYVLDCVSAILKVLFRGKPVNAYNISNDKSVIRIREMAKLIAKTGNVHIKCELPNEIEKKGFNPMKSSAVDSTALRELGWLGKFDAERGIEHTVKILKEVVYA